MTYPPAISAPQPTELDRKNAALRQSVAERQADEYAEAMRVALDTLGPGWRPWMKICLIDADHRQSGDTTAVATVFKVYHGEARLSENSVFLCLCPTARCGRRTATSRSLAICWTKNTRRGQWKFEASEFRWEGTR